MSDEHALYRRVPLAAAATKALSALAGFAKSLKVKYEDIEVGFDFPPEPGLADNGDLEHDLQALLEQVGLAAKAADTALVIFIDELQYVQEIELSALITAMHRCAQRRVPVMLVGAGLPQLRGRMGNAKSYAERLFDVPEFGPLPRSAARSAIDIADCLGRAVTSLGPTRNNLIAKGMIWSPNPGDTAFTVPLFDEFMTRIVPGGDWRN